MWPGEVPPPPGFFALLLGPGSTGPVATEEAIIQLSADMGYLRPGDLIRIFSDGRVNVVYRRADGNIGWIDPAAGAKR